MLSCTEITKVNVGFTQANREQGIRRLTAINLMKRMESSVYSFNLTLTRIKDLINSTIETIDRFDKHSGTTLDLTDISDMDEFDAEDQNSDELFLSDGKSESTLPIWTMYPGGTAWRKMPMCLNC